MNCDYLTEISNYKSRTGGTSLITYFISGLTNL